MMNQENEMTVNAEQLPSSSADLLPSDEVFKVKIGQKLFEISGAVLSSDGPNFFTRFFTQHDNNVVLFMDRSEDVFVIIYRHLQGYFPKIQDEEQFSTLFTDALFFQLPKLVKLLKEYDYYFTNVGGVSFKVPKSLFHQQGNRKNYLEMISGTFYKEMGQYDSDGKLDFLRQQSPFHVPRSPEFFQDLLSLLGGAELNLSEKRTASLIKECRYYRFGRLEQELMKAKIIYNPLTHGQDICLALSNVSKSSVTIEELLLSCTENQHPAVGGCSNQSSENDNYEPPSKKTKPSTEKHEKHWNMVKYQRPYIDTVSHDLIFQLNSNQCKIIFNKKDKTVHVDLSKEAAKLFENKFSDLLLKTPNIKIDLSEYKVNLCDSQMQMEPHLIIPACVSICDLVVNGTNCCNIFSLVNDSKCKERVLDCTNLKNLNCAHGLKLHLSKSMWKLGTNNGKIILIAVKAEAFSGTKEYCKMIDFL
ncbi:YLR108C [Saccharomyces arboricola H-6]|uniref:YLR108C n=1 Tax=Saccharomyces arboricola (strain H-6 / AS 2.3317 / CBS 10644) TaxID=1160507 RepID=J8Q237_SACAR|nr:YLR108C [Saccharomyces arboricola H-6]